MTRITETYVPGNGDLGHSNILHGLPPIRKDHRACDIQGLIESLRNKIELLFCQSKLIQKDLIYILEWIDRNIFSLASFCYLKGNSTKHQMPMEFLIYMNDRTEFLKKELGDCPDFLMQSYPTLVYLDSIRIEARQLERAYIGWWYSSEITNFLMEKNDLIHGVRKYAAVINRLSAYLFEATRMEALLLKESGVAIAQKHWQAEIEPFNPPLFIIKNTPEIKAA